MEMYRGRITGDSTLDLIDRLLTTWIEENHGYCMTAANGRKNIEYRLKRRDCRNAFLSVSIPNDCNRNEITLRLNNDDLRPLYLELVETMRKDWSLTRV